MMMRYSKRRASTGLLTLCLGTAAALVVPSAALGAASGTGGTVRATIDNNGAVTTVRQISTNGATSAFAGQLPIKMSITRTVSGTTQTYTYHVENTFSQTQTVHYTDTAGHERHTSVTLQLPLVAQLGVDAPQTMSDINAPGAEVTAGALGTRHLLWNMVLFSPLGTSTQDVSFTASGRGVPITELRATAVDPNTAPGLSAKSQDKTAEYQQADFWTSFAGGGNDGLTKLADGTSKMVVGLGTLLSGLQTGVAGADKLASGSADAHDGSIKLSSGLEKIHGGQGDLTTGLTKIQAGLANTPTGLTGGLALINGGLAQLADNKTGLQKAVNGTQQIKAGVDAVIGLYIGHDPTDPTDPTTGSGLLGGIALEKAGLTLLATGVQQSSACAVDILSKVSAGSPGVPQGADPCAPLGLPPMPGLDPASSAVVGGLIAQFGAVAAGTDTTFTPGIAKLQGGLDSLHSGLTHPPVSAADPGGAKEVLQAVDGGLAALLDPKTGLPFAVSGVKQLSAGSAKALAGSRALLAGSGQAVDGSQKLFVGSGTALAGSQTLATGLGQIATGNQQVADGLPPAVSGVSQLLDGATQVHDGITQVQSGATGPLAAQLTQASVNAHQQIAVLNASTALASQSPGGAGTSYVLAQPGSFALVGASTSTSSGDDHTGRNTALIAIGGVLALAIGLGVGIAMGRSRVAA